jgi:hypothetical protein
MTELHGNNGKNQFYIGRRHLSVLEDSDYGFMDILFNQFDACHMI